MRSRSALAVLLVAGAAGATALAAASETITIAAYPGIVRWPAAASLSGQLSNGKGGELVTLEAKQCPSQAFQELASTRTTEGGAWSAEAGAQTKTTIRAAWQEVRSREVVVLVRPHLVLGQVSTRAFRAILMLGRFANGKRLVLQRYRGEGRGWTSVKTIAFRSPSTGWPQMTFSAKVPKGTLLRLTLPRAQAQPCYLAGYSNLLQT